MRILSCVTVFILLTFAVKSQNAGDYRTIASGIWITPTIWEVYNGSSWQPASTSPNYLNGYITIRQFHQITIPSGIGVMVDELYTEFESDLTIFGLLNVANTPEPYEVNINGTMRLSGSDANILLQTSAKIRLQNGGAYVHNSSRNAATIATNFYLEPTSNWIFRKYSSFDNIDVSLTGQYGNLRFENVSGLPWTTSLNGGDEIQCSSFYVGSNVAVNNHYTGNIRINGSLSVYGGLINGIGKQRFTFTGPACDIFSVAVSNISGFYDTLTVATGASLELKINLTGANECVFYVYGKLNVKNYTVTGNTISTFKLFSNSIFQFTSPEIDYSVYNFQFKIAESNVSYEVNSLGFNPMLRFWNSTILHLNINTEAIRTTTFYNPSEIYLNGTMMITSGSFNLLTSTLRLYGPPLAGNTANFQTTSSSNMLFMGNSPGHFIPINVSQLSYIWINNPAGVTLNHDLTIVNRINFFQGIFDIGSNIVTIGDNDPDGSVGSSDNSYIKGTVVRRVKWASGYNLIFPVGGDTYQPITFNNISSNGITYLKVSPYQTTPDGTGAPFSVRALANRYWHIATTTTNTISSIGGVTVRTPGVLPELTYGSCIALSTSNSANSYFSIPTQVNSPNLSSFTGITNQYLLAIGWPTGLYLSVGLTPLPGGKYCIGPSTFYTGPSGIPYINGSKPFQNLSQAIGVLNMNCFLGPVIFEIQNNYTSAGASEVFPLIITYQGSPSMTATFQPRIDVTGIVYISGSIPSSGNTTGLIELDGADYITFDGSPGGTMGTSRLLGISNPGNNIFANILIKNDAQNNTINAIWSEASGSSKNIYINGNSGTSGNDFLTIRNCFLTNKGMGSTICESQISASGIVNGNAATNDLQIVSNVMTNAERGVFISSSVNGNINISNNSFNGNVINSDPRLMQYGVYIYTPEPAQIIAEGNYYGGTNANATVNNMPVTNVGSVYGFQILNQSASSTNSINNNIIRSIDIGNLSTSAGFNGIYVSGPATIMNNMIGDTNKTNSINFHSTNQTFADFKGIVNVNNPYGNPSTITGNVIQNVVFNAGASVNATFNGIYFLNSSTALVATVSDNLIRNLVSENNITITGIDLRASNLTGSNTIVQRNKIETISTSAPTNLTGINVTSKPCTFSGNRLGKFDVADDINIIGSGNSYGFKLAGSAGLLVAEDDTVANITLQGSSLYAFTGGWVDNSGTFAHITQRIIVKNLTTSSHYTGSSLIGIHWLMGSNVSLKLNDNIVENLIATNQSAHANVTGIFCGNWGTIYNNTVRKLYNFGSGSSPAPAITGITNNGSYNYMHHNTVAIDLTGTTAVTVRGIMDQHMTGNAGYHFNSVSLTGNLPSSTQRTYAFYKYLYGGPLHIRNNIIQNACTGGDKNFAIGVSNGDFSAWQNGASDYNSLYAVNPATIGEYGTGNDQTLSQWQTSTNGDWNSFNHFASFVDPGSDLHLTSGNCLLKGAGTVLVQGYATDIDGQPRLSPPSIGIDEVTETCDITFNLKAFIQGYFRDNAMLPVLYSLGVSTDTNACDTILLEFRNTIAPYTVSITAQAILRTDGMCSVTIPEAKLGEAYYIVIKHRSALETWSAVPVILGTWNVTYDFSTAASKAYGNNQVSLGAGVFGFYNGDVSNGTINGIQDGIINMSDYTAVESACGVFHSAYVPYDLTGDLISESDDYSLLENNLSAPVSVQRP